MLDLGLFLQTEGVASHLNLGTVEGISCDILLFQEINAEDHPVSILEFLSWMEIQLKISS